jgi:hypothetical protein
MELRLARAGRAPQATTGPPSTCASRFKFSAFNAVLSGLDLRPDGILRVAFAQYE